MLKNKLKFIAILLISFLLCSYSSVLAVDTNTAEATQYGVMPISEEVNTTDSSTNSIEPREGTSDGSETVEPVATDDPSNGIVTEGEVTSEGDLTADTTAETTSTPGSKFLKGDNVTIDENISGNLFVYANSVTINSQIDGDAFVITKNLTVSETGYVINNLFVISDEVLINGVSNNLYVSAKNVSIENGFIYSDLYVNCENLNIHGSVGRDVISKFDNVSFTTDSLVGLISGNFTYYANEDLQIPTEYIQGTVERKDLPTATFQDYLVLLGSLLVLTLVIWGLSKWISPKFIDNSTKLLKVKKVAIALSGLIGLIGLPIVAFVLLLIGITSNVGLILLLLYMILVFIAKPVFLIATSQYISEKLKMNKTIASLGILILTGIVLWAICLIPYVGFVISIITIIIGIGILFTNLLTRASNADLDKLVEKRKENKSKNKNSKKEKKSNDNNLKETNENK